MSTCRQNLACCLPDSTTCTLGGDVRHVTGARHGREIEVSLVRMPARPRPRPFFDLSWSIPHPAGPCRPQNRLFGQRSEPAALLARNSRSATARNRAASSGSSDAVNPASTSATACAPAAARRAPCSVSSRTCARRSPGAGARRSRPAASAVSNSRRAVFTSTPRKAAWLACGARDRPESRVAPPTGGTPKPPRRTPRKSNDQGPNRNQ